MVSRPRVVVPPRFFSDRWTFAVAVAVMTAERCASRRWVLDGAGGCRDAIERAGGIRRMILRQTSRSRQLAVVGVMGGGTAEGQKS